MPIIGNGNVNSLEEGQRMMMETGCDGVMVARAAIRNPWIFRSLSSLSISDVQDESNNRLRDSEIGRPHVQLSAEHWPSFQEIVEAEVGYFKSVARSNSKQKFANFHKMNFQRIKNCVESGNLNQLVRSPRTIHL